jgi:5-methylcytosine-specific restriction protein B
MALEPLLEIVGKEGGSPDWPEANKRAFKELFGSGTGRYPAVAEKAVALRAPTFRSEEGVPFAAFIHPANPDQGPYGGMSIAIFPVKDAPCLVSFVVGTQGLSPDEDILGRPGHARKVQAISAWLNAQYGRGRLVAWAKQDPVRTEVGVPGNVASQFKAYHSVFERYGRVLYGIFALRMTPRQPETPWRHSWTSCSANGATNPWPRSGLTGSGCVPAGSDGSCRK